MRGELLRWLVRAFVSLRGEALSWLVPVRSILRHGRLLQYPAPEENDKNPLILDTAQTCPCWQATHRPACSDSTHKQPPRNRRQIGASGTLVPLPARFLAVP